MPYIHFPAQSPALAIRPESANLHFSPPITISINCAIPVEILAEIFLFVLESSKGHLPLLSGAHHRPVSAPFFPLHPNLWGEFHIEERYNIERRNIRCVCTHWDLIMKGDPRCWRHILYSGRQSVSILQSWIFRSGSLPLTLVLRIPLQLECHTWIMRSRHSEPVSISRRFVHNLFDTFNAEKDRINSIDVSSLCSIQMGVVMRRIPLLLTGKSLTSLALNQRGQCFAALPSPTIPFIVQPLDSFLLPSRLSHLVLSLTCVTFSSPPDLSALTVLDLHIDGNNAGVARDWDSLHLFMSSAYNLEILFLTLPSNPSVSPGSSTLLLPRLSSFTLALTSHRSAGQLIRQFVMPQLTVLSLTLYAWPGDERNYTELLLGMAGNVTPGPPPSNILNGLTTLVLTWIIADRFAIFSALRELVNLDTFVIHNLHTRRSGTSKFLAVLMHSSIRVQMMARQGNVEAMLCPCLRLLYTYKTMGRTERFLEHARRYAGFPITCIMSTAPYK